MSDMFDSVSGTAINLGCHQQQQQRVASQATAAAATASAPPASKPISSLAKEAKVESGLLKDSTMTRPAVMSQQQQSDQAALEKTGKYKWAL